MLNVNMLSAVMLSTVMLNDNVLSAVMLNDNVLSAVMLNVNMLSAQVPFGLALVLLTTRLNILAAGKRSSLSRL
jgi:hypothetical protein